MGPGDLVGTGWEGAPVGVITRVGVGVGAEVTTGRLHGTPVEIFMSSAVPLASAEPAGVTPP